MIAVDASADMIARARSSSRASAPTCAVRSRGLELEPGEQVDAVFSNATFHWVPDHDALFARLAAALRPGGRMSTQCGGEGNVAAVHETALLAAADAGLAEHFEGWPRPWNFAGTEQTEARLRAAGFEQIECWLQPYPVVPEEPRAYLRPSASARTWSVWSPRSTSASWMPSWRASTARRRSTTCG